MVDQAAQQELENERQQEVIAAVQECIERKVSTRSVLALIRETGINIRDVLPTKRGN